MLEEREKKLVYAAVTLIVILIFIVLLIIWIPSFSNKAVQKTISTVTTYNTGDYQKEKKEYYKTVVRDAVEEDNFDSTYEKINPDYINKLGYSKEELKNYLKNNKLLTYTSSSAVIYCSHVRTDGQKYIYTFVYKTGNFEIKVHIIEEYYETYTISFEQDTYPLLSNKTIDVKDPDSGLEFKITQTSSGEETIGYNIQIINNTSEEYTFNFDTLSSSTLLYNAEGMIQSTNLSAVVVGNEFSEFIVSPATTKNVDLMYTFNIDNEQIIKNMLFNNVKNTAGDSIVIQLSLT